MYKPRAFFSLVKNIAKMLVLFETPAGYAIFKVSCPSSLSESTPIVYDYLCSATGRAEAPGGGGPLQRL